MKKPISKKRTGDPTAGPADRATPPSVSCCCSARPVVEVLMPVTAERPSLVELLLCGHHYRISRDTVERAGAHVFDISGRADAYLRLPA